MTYFLNKIQVLSLSWLYVSWIYNYLCNQCLSPLKIWVRTLLRRCVLDTTLCDKVCQLVATGQWFFPGTPVSSTNKTNCHDITEILLKVALNIINQPTNRTALVHEMVNYNVYISCYENYKMYITFWGFFFVQTLWQVSKDKNGLDWTFFFRKGVQMVSFIF
jgi:hypothetical protein